MLIKLLNFYFVDIFFNFQPPGRVPPDPIHRSRTFYKISPSHSFMPPPLVMQHSLKLILYLTGNQLCKGLKIGVVCDERKVRVKLRAKEFCTFVSNEELGN